ncbi:MAG: N-acetylmuramoyl-L-alanine amidase [Proteobacteria bacterium]|nr:N-acetylmuramoyl-L-alanine amidase [Pseudomonadota bacterium]
MSHRCGAFLLMALLPLLSAVERPAGLGDVVDVRFWSYPDYTRVVVELDRSVEVEVRRLPADVKAERPERLYVDLPRIWVGRRYADGVEVGDGLLRDVRLGQNTLQSSRLVLDLEQYDRHRLLTLRSPDRVVLDVYGRRDGRDSHPGDASEPLSRLSMPLRSIRTVVVDPGHGGRDPGAIGLGGIREKDLNLEIARLLRKRLEQRGFQVMLTRDDDRTLDLEERTAVAESANGDLFISIHANASPRRSTRGLEIYYLDESHERHSLGVAARENGVPASEVDSLQRTLARLRVSEASVHSGQLAQLVHDEVVPSLRRNHRDFQDLGVKKGPFYVLFMSSMPSILVEAGFLTNRADVKLLRDDAFLEGLAEQIASGLERYRDRESHLASGVGG